MASVSASEVSTREERAVRQGSNPVLVVLLWLIVTIPLLWGVMMALKDVPNLMQ